MRSLNIQVGAALLAAAVAAGAQTMQAPDITKTETLYVIPYAHLDTQWRWEFPQTISEYLLKTMRVNFDLIDKYPHYVFNWTGANRYRLMKEYFPNDYSRMKQYIAQGRWFPAGSSMEEGDVNMPNAEAIIRQVLYGNTYFRKEFGKASEEYMLPDCFGFPASLPSILAHAGVKGFSTQKLSSGWQPAPRVGGPDSVEQTPQGIPFNVGIWQGTDGKTVIAALNPGGYGSTVNTDLSKEPPPPPPVDPNGQGGRGRGGRGPQEQDWVKRIDLDGKVTGVYADYHYVGTGDIGGAVNEQSVKLLEATVTKGMASLPTFAGRGGRGGRGQTNEPPPPPNPPVPMGEGPVHVVISAADQMFKDIKPEMTARMPQYKGDLELINHSAGSLTSQAEHKRWNRKNELLADAAEKASVAAEWMGGRPYPQQRLNDAWTLVMAGHFHDSAAGTATPRSYEFIWNDDVIALNQFSTVLTSATEAIASGLNTQGRGTAIVVYNPLNIAREDVVEASVALPAGTHAIRVIGPDGKETPSQYESGKAIFVAKAPSVGYAVYDVEPAAAAYAQNALSVQVSATASTLENARYRVTVNSDGDVSSIFDKSLNKELLSAPVRLAVSHDAPHDWPAWNMDWDQVHAAPRGYVGGTPQMRLSEDGPARVAIEATREFEGSKFVSTVRLSAGDAGNRVEFANAIDWKGLASNVKATFALTASNQNATYNWDIGTIQRPTEDERQFEVASHQWIDLTDQSGSYGSTILTDVKNASDKYDDHTIRLTLLRTPGGDTRYTDQFNQDWGHHEILFGIAGHTGDWRSAQTDWQGQRLNDPLVAFEAPKHAGALGKEFSLLKIDNPRIRVMALKKAETSDEVVLRMVELDGKPAANVHVHFAGPIASAREVNGQELPVGPATVQSGALVTGFTAYQPRTFALKLGSAPGKIAAVTSKPVTLQYDLAAASNDDTKTAGGFDAKGNALPAEMLPSSLEFDGVEFHLASAGTGKANAVVAKGQKIDLPAGRYNRVYVLAAAAGGDQAAQFRVGDKAENVTVEDWGGFVGQWDTRLWKQRPPTIQPGGGRFGGNGTPPPPTPLRQSWAVSANHATWDVADRGSPNWSPNYPADFLGMSPAYIKRADLAWYASHHHTAEGLNEPYQYSYLFAYAIDLPANARTLTLPDNSNIRVLAVSVAEENPEVKPAQPLYDVLGSK